MLPLCRRRFTIWGKKQLLLCRATKGFTFSVFSGSNLIIKVRDGRSQPRHLKQPLNRAACFAWKAEFAQCGCELKDNQDRDICVQRQYSQKLQLDISIYPGKRQLYTPYITPYIRCTLYSKSVAYSNTLT